MARSTYILALISLAAALLVSGCGGSSDEVTGDASEVSKQATESSVPGQPLSRSEFVKRAEQICKKADDDVYDEAGNYREKHEKELEKLSPIPAEEKMIRLFVLPSIKKQAKEIEALGLPKGEEKKVGALFAALALGIRNAEKNPYAIEDEVPSEYPFIKYSELARAYGFGECANLA